MTWTDHISDTAETGTGFVVEGCLNGHPSWAMFSLVVQQSRYNLEEARGQLVKENKFKRGTQVWGNFNSWY
jgi:hypothetical protein